MSHASIPCALLLAILASAVPQGCSRVGRPSAAPTPQSSEFTEKRARSHNATDSQDVEDAEDVEDVGDPKQGGKMVVEARVGLAVDEIAAATEALRTVSRRLGGKVVRDEVMTNSAATFIVRIPPKSVSNLLEEIQNIGDITHRHVGTTDVTKSFTDHEIQLDNLGRALERYQQILDRATNVTEMLAVEEQLTRVRGQIERIKGELNYLRDKVDLATVTVNILPKPKHQPVGFTPKAKFHPGLRYSCLATLAKGKDPRGFFGPGFSIHLARFWALDVDILSDARRDPWRADAVSATVSGATYSDFLGRGKRTWLNPYVGYAIGYARIDTDDTFSIGTNLGVELFKNNHLLIDANLRTLALIGDDAPRLAIQGTLAANIAF